MNNEELDRLLKSARVPEREPEFWSDFPRSVTAAIRRGAATSRTDVPERSSRKWAYAAWGFGLAAACVVISLALGVWRGNNSGVATSTMAEAKTYYREIEKLFPNQVRAIVFDRQGAHLVLADHADVPGSPALFVKICGANDCERVITFSGQEFQFEGKQYEVLADEAGRVMLVGDNRVWSGDEAAGSIKIEARLL